MTYHARIYTHILFLYFVRLTPLREKWADIYTPIAEHMKLQIRYNPNRKCIEMKVIQNIKTFAV